MERRKCSNRPLKIITNFFTRRGKHKNQSGLGKDKGLLDHENNPSTPGNKSLDCISAGSTCRSTGDLELDALHLSRRDNPYLQILNSRECLLSDSPPPPTTTSSSMQVPPYSPCRSSDPLIISPDSHAHLVRSPPPISWPISPRSVGTLSPPEYTTSSSVDGLDEFRGHHCDEGGFLGSRSVNASMMLSPVRGATPPEFVASPGAYGRSSSRFSNWRGLLRNGMGGNGDYEYAYDSYHQSECISPKSTQNDVGANLINSVDGSEGGMPMLMSSPYRLNFLSGSRSLISQCSGGIRPNRTSSVARRDTAWRTGWRSKSDIKSMENLINDGCGSSLKEDEKTTNTPSSSSPRTHRASFHLRKSINLRPKSGPTYMDIESQS